VIYLNKDDILSINQNQIQTYGGIFIAECQNIHNPSSLDYLLEIVQSEIFGKKLYPNVYSIASAYCFFIIKDHIFVDGNKRTGSLSSFLFLAKNSYILKTSITNRNIVDFTKSIESGKIDHPKITKWYIDNSIKIS
jgi:death on curing protein